MIEDRIEDEIQAAINAGFGKHIKTADILVEKPQEIIRGDFTTNVSFRLANELGKSPAVIAEKIAALISQTNSFKKVECVSGFVNFFLDSEQFSETITRINKEGKSYGNSDAFKGKKVQIEFISANPTGPLTIAIGRGGFGGDVLANLFEKSGAKVTREYYVNDGGNQVLVLGNSLLIAAGKLEAEGDFYRGEYIEQWIKVNAKKVEELKEEPFELGCLCAKDVLEKYIKPATKDMKINFDVWYSEKSLYERNLPEKAITYLKKEGLTYEKEGATWLKTSKFGDEKDRVIIKSDGNLTYVTPDIAYHWEKFSERKFDLVVNILGADHHGYTDRMIAGVTALGYGDKIKYLLTQMVKLVKNGKEYRLSKRKGVVVTMDDLLGIIGGEKGSASDVARFFFLSRSFNTHMEFDLDLAKDNSDKNPVFYVKYAYARLSGILRNAEVLKTPKPNLSLLIEPEEHELISELSKLPGIIEGTLLMKDYPVHNLTFYSRAVASKFHSFYDRCRVIDEDNLELTAARMELVKATKTVLGIVLAELLGLDAPEKM